jgi:hypothetical protein
MPLYDVTHDRDVLVNPRDAENYDILQGALRALDTRRFAKDVRIIDGAIQLSIDEATANNRLVFTKAGILVGHHSLTPHADVNHVWESAELSYPAQLPSGRINEVAAEVQLKFVGGLVRWRISVLVDTWLVYREPNGEHNKFTGKEIRVSKYWVDNNYVVPIKYRKHQVSDLVDKFHHVR